MFLTVRGDQSGYTSGRGGQTFSYSSPPPSPQKNMFTLSLLSSILDSLNPPKQLSRSTYSSPISRYARKICVSISFFIQASPFTLIFPIKPLNRFSRPFLLEGFFSGLAAHEPAIDSGGYSFSSITFFCAFVLQKILQLSFWLSESVI